MRTATKAGKRTRGKAANANQGDGLPALDEVDELRNLYKTDGEVREIIDYAKKLEGLARNIGTHAAAVVAAKD